MYASVNTNYYIAVFFLYISILLNMYQVNFARVEMFFVSYKCTMFSFLPEHYDRLQEMVLKASFRQILKAKYTMKPMFFQGCNKI